jgi:hypothetical protein
VSDLVYLYGFVPSDAAAPSDLIGIGGRAVELLRTAGFQAALSRVPQQTYDPERIETRLQDLSWVAEQGVAHESVVAWFVDNAQILPVPLFTMYSGDDALKQTVAQRAASIETELARLHGKREWDIKVSFNESDLEQHAAALSPRIAELDAEVAAASPGKRYLLQKKRADLLKSESRKAAREQAQQVLDAASSLVVETRTLPIPRTADELPVIAYAAHLVERNREGNLIALLETESARLKTLGMDLTFSGPWAPYRFTREHDRAAAGG